MTLDVGLFKLHEEVEWGTTIRGQVRRVTGRIVMVVPPGQRPADLRRSPVRLEDDEGARDHESYVVRAQDGAFYWPRVSALAPAAARIVTTDHDRATLRDAERAALEGVTGERDELAREVESLRASRAALAAVVEEFQDRGVAFSEAIGQSLVRHCQRLAAATSVDECKASARTMLEEIRAATPGPGPVLTALATGGGWPISA